MNVTMMMVVTTMMLVAMMMENVDDNMCTDMKARSAPVELLIAVLQPGKH